MYTYVYIYMYVDRYYMYVYVYAYFQTCMYIYIHTWLGNALPSKRIACFSRAPSLCPCDPRSHGLEGGSAFDRERVEK